MSTIDDQGSESVNPLLVNRVLPGETYRLPSQGLFYKDGELDDTVKNGEVHILPMTTYDEIVIRSPDKLFSGAALDEVFARCVPQIKKPRQLLAKDVDFIFVCLRLITYSQNLPLLYTHTCENAKEHSYEVPLQPIIKNARPIDPTTLGKTFKVVTSDGNQVNLKPSTYGSLIDLNQSVDNMSDILNVDVLAKSIFDTLSDSIESVSGITNKAQIREWLASLSAGDVRKIGDQMGEGSDWGITPMHTVKCRDCGEDIQLQFVTNPISFFS